MRVFKVVSKYAGHDELLPTRATIDSAGYDMVAAEDTIIPSFFQMYNIANRQTVTNEPISLKTLKTIISNNDIKMPLVSTGVKVYLNEGEYLKLVARSSLPYKHWILCANSEGIIDKDYADNPDNEGEIFFQIINLSPWSIEIHKGDVLCQGIICSYLKTNDDFANAARVGGFGSTPAQKS